MNEKNNHVGEDSISVEIGGKIISFSTGKLARQANASVLVKCGSSGVLVTAVMSENADKNSDFFPLVVDVEERMYAAGKIPGGFLKREGRSGESSILSARLMDRPIRPLFPDGFFNEVQIIANVFSLDNDSPADTLGILGESIALNTSIIPFQGIVAAVRVG